MKAYTKVVPPEGFHRFIREVVDQASNPEHYTEYTYRPVTKGFLWCKRDAEEVSGSYWRGYNIANEYQDEGSQWGDTDEYMALIKIEAALHWQTDITLDDELKHHWDKLVEAFEYE